MKDSWLEMRRWLMTARRMAKSPILGGDVARFLMRMENECLANAIGWASRDG
jgi:hypothetical protein